MRSRSLFDGLTHNSSVLDNPIFRSIEDRASYLVLILDRKLYSQPNLDARIKKAATPLYTAKRMVGPEWGLAPRVTHWLYTTVIWSFLAYGILATSAVPTIKTVPAASPNIFGQEGF